MCIAWTVWALRRTKLLWIGQALMAPLAMSIVNLPSYYFAFFIVTAVLAKLRPGLGPVLLATTGASQILLLSYYWVDDKFSAQAWLFWIFGLVVLFSLTRLRSERVLALNDGDGASLAHGRSALRGGLRRHDHRRP